MQPTVIAASGQGEQPVERPAIHIAIGQADAFGLARRAARIIDESDVIEIGRFRNAHRLGRGDERVIVEHAGGLAGQCEADGALDWGCGRDFLEKVHERLGEKQRTRVRVLVEC